MKEFAQPFVCVITLFFAHCAQAQVWFQDNFDSNTTVNTAAYPTTDPPPAAGDFDPDAPVVGTWTISPEDDPEWAQVSSFTGGDQPDSAHSGNNYLIAGHNADISSTFDAQGIATANLTQAVSKATVEFWIWQEPWTQSNQYGVVQGRRTGAGGGRAWELTFENNERVKFNSNGGGGGTTLPAELLLIENAWNHIVMDYDSGAGEFGEAIITINGIASPIQPTLSGINPVLPNSFNTIQFRPENHGYFDGILVSTPSVQIGDYNKNGTVDAADYTLWRDNNGTPFPLDNRDPANTGDVSAADYTSWQTRFGQGGASAASAAAVPEPSCLLIVSATLLGSVALGRGRKSVSAR